MTPDDSSIPEDDAIARAARRALDALAGGVSNDGGWDGVQVGARRVRQRRVAAVVAACAIVLAGAGAASAIAGGGSSGSRHTNFAGAGASTTTTTETSTSSTTTRPTTTTTAPGSPAATVPGVAAPTTTTVPVPIAQAGDLSGTLALASTTVVAEQPTGVFLTLQNTSGHTVSLYSAQGTYLGVVMQGFASTATANANVIAPDPSTLGAGETRTFAATVTPPPEMVGTATISAAILQGYVHFDPAVAYALSGVTPVPITVVPPGTTTGQPLDPSLGKWTAVMSADATEVTAGGTVEVHAQLTNTGDQPQNTQGYGSLVIACGNSQGTDAIQAEFIGADTLAPGETQSFSLPLQTTDYSPKALVCWFGIAFHANPAEVARSAGISTDTVQIAVLDAGSSTTSTAPDPASPTTSP